MKIGVGRELVAQFFSPRKVRPLSLLEYQPKARSTSTRAKDVAREIEALRRQWQRPRQTLAQCRAGLTRPERAVLDYLREVTARFAQRGTKVLFIASPHTSPWLCFLRDELDPELPVVLFNNPTRFPELYKVAERRNASHLNSEGAVAYSRELGRVATEFLLQPPKLAYK